MAKMQKINIKILILSTTIVVLFKANQNMQNIKGCKYLVW